MELTHQSSLSVDRWGSGKAAVQAVKDLALAQGKHAVVVSRGGTFRRLQCDSVSTGCLWFVTLARQRSVAGPGDWRVTGSCLEHQNCVGVSKPSRNQLVRNPVVRAALTADVTASARALVAQVRHQDRVVPSQHVMYRARDSLMTEMFSEDPTTIQQLPSLLAEFSKLNPGTLTDIQRDEKGRFHRAIVVLDPQWFQTGQGIYGVDVGHMKHRKYNGVQIIMVSRDGNSNNQICAVALAPVEDQANYNWFFGHVLNHGFPLTTSPVFSDRNLGLVSAAEGLQIFNMFCVRHIIGNMRADKTVRLTVSQERHVWAANAATTSVAFEESITDLSLVNTAAADYLKAIPANKWALHPHYDTTALHGWRTTNFVESEQAKSLRLKPRRMLPFEFFKSYMTILMASCYARVQLHRKWSDAEMKVTPRSQGKIQGQLREAAEYAVTHSSDEIAFVARVTQPLKQRRVDVGDSTCSCSTWKQQRLPCRHLIATLISTSSTDRIYELAGSCHTITSYSKSLGSLEIPEDDSLSSDPTLQPAPFVRQAGRPKKRRIRSRGETGGKARKVYRCTRCGLAGHNKKTCRAVPV